MSQLSFSDAEYAGKRKKTQREVFLDEMEQVVPWKALLKVIEPHYSVAGRGRRPYPLEAMLRRVHLMQKWFALSDPAMRFVGDRLTELEPGEVAQRRDLTQCLLQPICCTAKNGRCGPTRATGERKAAWIAT